MTAVSCVIWGMSVCIVGIDPSPIIAVRSSPLESLTHRGVLRDRSTEGIPHDHAGTCLHFADLVRSLRQIEQSF